MHTPRSARARRRVATVSGVGPRAAYLRASDDAQNHAASILRALSFSRALVQVIRRPSWSRESPEPMPSPGKGRCSAPDLVHEMGGLDGTAVLSRGLVRDGSASVLPDAVRQREWMVSRGCRSRPTASGLCTRPAGRTLTAALGDATTSAMTLFSAFKPIRYYKTHMRRLPLDASWARAVDVRASGSLTTSCRDSIERAA